MPPDERKTPQSLPVPDAFGSVVLNERGHMLVLADVDAVDQFGPWWDRQDRVWRQEPGEVVEIVSWGVDGRG